MIYGYCRVSATHQGITRQVNNILSIEPKTTIIKEFFTGTTQSKPQWIKLLKKLRCGDTIIFYSVSRMSRNSDEGFKDYKSLYEIKIKSEICCCNFRN